MGKAFLASLFLLCLNFLLLIELLPFTPAGCIVTLLIAGVATTTVQHVFLGELGRKRTANGAVAFFIAVFLIYSCGLGLLLSYVFGRFEPFDIAYRTLFLLTFVTIWGFFREAFKSRA